jgi:hypothetical protein
MSRRKRSKPSAAGVDADGKRVLDALDLAVMRELIAEIPDPSSKGFKLLPPPPARTDSWFIEQEAKNTPPPAMRSDADQTYVDLVRWRCLPRPSARRHRHCRRQHRRQFLLINAKAIVAPETMMPRRACRFS